MLVKRVALVSLVAALACVGGASCGSRTPLELGSSRADGGESFDGSFDGAQEKGDVTGRAVTHFRMDGGKVADVAFDLSKAKIVVYVEKDGGGYDAIDGAGHADGTLVVHGVPFRPFVLRIDATMFVHSARDVTLNRIADGRPDAVPMDWLYAPLSLRNLAPWTTSPFSSSVWLVSSNAGAAWLARLDGMSAIAAGATTVDSPRATFGRATGGTIDPSRGDRSILFQLNPVVAPDGTPYRAVVRTLDLPTFAARTKDSPTNGSPIDGAMVDVAMTETLRYEWDAAAFTPHAARALADGAPNQRFVVMNAEAHTGGVGVAVGYFAGGILVIANERAPFIDGAHVVPYGQPFPGWIESSQWELVFTAARSVADPEAGSIQVGAELGFFGHIPVSGKITPSISTVLDATIDGAPLLASVATVSAAPTFAWSAPTIVTSAQPGSFVYAVTICPAVPSDTPCVSASTSDTRFELPPGFLTSGVAYVASIDATRVVDASILAARPYDGVSVGDLTSVSAPFVVR